MKHVSDRGDKGIRATNTIGDITDVEIVPLHAVLLRLGPFGREANFFGALLEFNLQRGQILPECEQMHSGTRLPRLLVRKRGEALRADVGFPQLLVGAVAALCVIPVRARKESKVPRMLETEQSTCRKNSGESLCARCVAQRR